MKQINVMNNISIPNVAVGCMRIDGLTKKDLTSFLDTAMSLKMNFFDHADIYGGGKCEEVFAEALSSNYKREDYILQSKCGIRNGFFDFSKEHILSSVDGILKRLKTEYLDILLLHRPDALVEPEEVAAAFELLKASGKVKHFGVSNQNPAQIELLKRSVKTPILFNQLQLSITNSTMMDAGMNVNMTNEAAVNRDNSVLDYCRLNNITIQAWSPFQYGFFEGVFLGNPKFQELNKTIDKLAEKYNVTSTGLAVAWILRHPAKIQTVLGTTNESRLKAIAAVSEIEISREDWYKIYTSAGHVLP